MGGIFRRPSPPPPPPPPPPTPKPDSSAGADARTKERQRYSRRKTILTGGQGVEEEAAIAKKTLLGQ
jgi:hypothetical protein